MSDKKDEEEKQQKEHQTEEEQTAKRTFHSPTRSRSLNAAEACSSNGGSANSSPRSKKGGVMQRMWSSMKKSVSPKRTGLGPRDVSSSPLLMGCRCPDQDNHEDRCSNRSRLGVGPKPKKSPSPKFFREKFESAKRKSNSSYSSLKDSSDSEDTDKQESGAKFSPKLLSIKSSLSRARGSFKGLRKRSPKRDADESELNLISPDAVKDEETSLPCDTTSGKSKVSPILGESSNRNVRRGQMDRISTSGPGPNSAIVDLSTSDQGNLNVNVGEQQISRSRCAGASGRQMPEAPSVSQGVKERLGAGYESNPSPGSVKLRYKYPSLESEESKSEEETRRRSKPYSPTSKKTKSPKFYAAQSKKSKDLKNTSQSSVDSGSEVGAVSTTEQSNLVGDLQELRLDDCRNAIESASGGPEIERPSTSNTGQDAGIGLGADCKSSPFPRNLVSVPRYKVDSVGSEAKKKIRTRGEDKTYKREPYSVKSRKSKPSIFHNLLQISSKQKNTPTQTPSDTAENAQEFRVEGDGKAANYASGGKDVHQGCGKTLGADYESNPLPGHLGAKPKYKTHRKESGLKSEERSLGTLPYDPKSSRAKKGTSSHQQFRSKYSPLKNKGRSPSRDSGPSSGSGGTDFDQYFEKANKAAAAGTSSEDQAVAGPSSRPYNFKPRNPPPHMTMSPSRPCNKCGKKFHSDGEPCPVKLNARQRRRDKHEGKRRSK